MATRLLAFFLAGLLLWTGYSTIEVPRLLAGGPDGAPLAEVIPAERERAPAGSIEDHHLDDQASTAHPDLALDVPGVPFTRHMASWPGVGGRSPSVPGARGVGPPWLAGLLRPPCTGSRTV